MTTKQQLYKEGVKLYKDGYQILQKEISIIQEGKKGEKFNVQIEYQFGVRSA